MDYLEMTQEQMKVLTNAAQLFEAIQHTERDRRRFDGTMHWKKIDGREYLYRGYSGGKSQSLGRRTEATEQLKDRYTVSRNEFLDRVKHLKEQMTIHAGYIRLNRLNRFPLTAADVIRAFRDRSIPARIIGTNALFAYELAAGILLMPEFLTTDDLDLLMDSRQSVQIVTALKSRTLLSTLKEVDESFVRLSDSPFEFAAVNKDGYRVDFVTQESRDLRNPNVFFKMLKPEDIKPQGIGSLKWLVNAPGYVETVFDQRGFPVQIETVDPRAFVIHKYYIATNERVKATKKKKDLAQATLIAELLRGPLSHLEAPEAITRLFPAEVSGAQQ